MNIKSIQPSQVAPADLRSSERTSSRLNADLRLPSEPSPWVSSGSPASSRVAQLPEVEAQVLISRIDYVKDQLEKILVDFPPFFPPGTYQRLDLIKGIRNIQDDIEKSSIADSVKKEPASEKLTEEATDHDITVALDELMDFRDEVAQNLPEQVASLNPGTMVSIRV